MLPRICIPSYNRSDTINLKTLKFLRSVDYPTDKIYIFVASELDQFRYSLTCPGCQIILGVPGLKPQRRFIQDFLDEGEIYIGMDDDVQGIKSLKPFLQIIRDGVQTIESRRTGLFGILPKDDARCFKDDTTEHLSFILGSFFICRNHKEILLEGSCLTDDFERSLLYFKKYGKIYRYRGAGVQTRYSGTSENTRDNFTERKRDAVLGLVKRFPDICVYRDKNGEPDILLNWRAKTISDE